MSSLKKYKRIKYLGKGSYGAAILVELKSDPKTKFVIKEIVIGHLKPAEQASARSEAEVLHQMSHSNITMYIESFIENSKLYIVMEHADAGDLSNAIQKRKADGKYYAEEELMRIYVQICIALKHVHAAKILHRDLKSQNVFLTSKGMVKLGDFGIAKVLDASEDQARTQIGTPYYLSPEICESKPYGHKSDIWSLGVILYELCALELPFLANSLPALVHKICNGEPNYSKISTMYSSSLINLTKSQLLKNPDQRPSVKQILKDSYTKSNISQLLSHTLKAGNGGVVGDESPAERDTPPTRSVSGDIEAARARLDQIKLAKQRQMQEKEQPPLTNKPSEPVSSRRNSYQDEEKDTSELYPPIRKAGEAPKVVVTKPSPAVKSLAEVQNERQQAKESQDVLIYQARGGVESKRSDYQDILTREYLNNKAAAKAFKERVEYNERYGGGYNAPTARGGEVVPQYNNRNVPSQNQPIQSNQANPFGSHYNPNAPPNGGNAALDRLNPEARIAQIKAQREQEKAKELAEKDEELRKAFEDNRILRKRLEQRNRQSLDENDLEKPTSKGNVKPSGVAFDIDISNNEKVPHFKAKEKAGHKHFSSSIPEVKASPSVDHGIKNKEEVATSSSSSVVKPRRGWGTPINPGELGLAPKGNNAAPNRPRDYEDDDEEELNYGRKDPVVTPPMRSEPNERTPPSSHVKESKQTVNDVNNVPSKDKKKIIMNEDGFNSDEEGVHSNVSPMSDKPINDDIVKERMANRRRSQVELREQAKDVLKKLREKRLKNVDSKSEDKEVTPMRARLKEVVNSVERANESVQKAIEGKIKPFRDRSLSPPRREITPGDGSKAIPRNILQLSPQPADSVTDKKVIKSQEVITVSQKNKNRQNRIREVDSDDDIEEVDPKNIKQVDDLESTLETWLLKQKRTVTSRKKNVPYKGIKNKKDESELSQIEESDEVKLRGYKTIQSRARDGESEAYEIDDEIVSSSVRKNTSATGDADETRDSYEDETGDDVEVVGLQYNLAQMLMDNDEDEDDT